MQAVAPALANPGKQRVIRPRPVRPVRLSRYMKALVTRSGQIIRSAGPDTGKMPARYLICRG